MSLIVNQGAILSPLKILVISPPLFLFSTAPVVNTLLLNGKESDRYMDGSTKILTVSYGTFSCTLEGFDDPLGAMRDIAEYFRDLAADDRYFGAEPLTPDAEMLQNIAEREVGRRVEARMGDGGVALRQVESRTEEAKLKTEPDVHEAAPETVEAVSEETTTDDREDDGVLAARVLTAAKTADTLAASKESKAPDAGTGPLTFDDEFLMSDEPEDVLAIDPGADVVDAGPAETVAEKLRRIRSVVSKNVEDRASADVIEGADETASGKRDRAFTDTIDQITADIADEEPSKPVAKVERTADEKPVDTVTDAKVNADQPDASFDDPQFTDIDIEVDDDSARTESAARDTSEALWVQDADAEAAASEMDLLRDDADDMATDLIAESLEDEDFDPDTSESLFRADDGVVDTNLDVEVTDAVLERTMRDQEPEEVAEKTSASEDATPDAGEQSSPPATAESDVAIKRTISDIIGNLSNRIAEDDDAEAQDEDVSQDSEPARSISKPLSEAQESDVGRLIEKTDSKLNEDEVVRRRRVISQMRAAVAATKADRLVSRQVSKEVVEEEERSPYREDLSEVVRSASIQGAGIERSSSSPPLVLVSSQRVDEVEANASTDQSDEPQNFAGFAEDMGAKELPELLEAAAAFTVFKEGQSSFTRPEIMKRVAAVDPTIRMSREESLRSFGQLLRQGKFRKLERGQFTIDKTTRYNPEHRIA